MKKRGQAPFFRIIFNSKHHIGYINPEWSHSFCTIMEPTLQEAVLTPDGNVWVCCDFVDLSYHNISDDEFSNIQSPIIGNIKVDTMDIILERKRKHVIKIRDMRAKDAVEEKLTNGKEIMCDNCKFYHFNKN